MYENPDTVRKRRTTDYQQQIMGSERKSDSVWKMYLRGNKLISDSTARSGLHGDQHVACRRFSISIK